MHYCRVQTEDIYSFGSYGNIRSKEGTTNSVFTFAGEQFDPETSLTFLRARYYDPSTGTFLSRDPVFGPLDQPLEHGEYLYARNNPVNLSDPSGELAINVGLQGSLGYIVGIKSTVGLAFVQNEEGQWQVGIFQTTGGGILFPGSLSVNGSLSISGDTDLRQLSGSDLVVGGSIHNGLGVGVEIGDLIKRKAKFSSISFSPGVGIGLEGHAFITNTSVIPIDTACFNKLFRR